MFRRSRAIALVETATFMVIFFILAWYFQASLGETYGWFSKTVMIILGLIGIFIHKDVKRYGLVPRNLRFSLKWSLYISLLFILLSLISIVIAFVIGSITPVDLRVIATDILWFFVFVGLAEELFFRGYVQSRLNEVFTARYRSILGVKYQWSQGTLITGFFFGIPHIFAGINPFMGYMRVTPVTIIVTGFACFMGVIFGVLREKSEDIIIPSVLHGFLVYTSFGIGKITGLAISGVASFLSLLLFFVLLFRRILEEKIDLKKDQVFVS